MRKKVYIAYTGGTIGMKHTTEGFVPASGYLERLMHSLPELKSDLLPEYDIGEKPDVPVAVTMHLSTEDFTVQASASPEKIANAFRIVRKDPNVKTILLNIFAGINRCDWVAEGVVQAMQEQDISEPVIVRLSGTNYEKGQKILNDSGLAFINAKDLDDAARKAVDGGSLTVIGTGNVQPSPSGGYWFGRRWRRPG